MKSRAQESIAIVKEVGKEAGTGRVNFVCEKRNCPKILDGSGGGFVRLRDDGRGGSIESVTVCAKG